jgi:hypothetical protein
MIESIYEKFLAAPESYVHGTSTNALESLHNSQHALASKRLNLSKSYVARTNVAIALKCMSLSVRLKHAVHHGPPSTYV